MAMLFSPFKIRNIEFRNRIVVSPMCTYSAHDGCATDWHVVHLGSRALGGAGAVMVEATAVVPEGRISGDDVGLWNDQQTEALRPVTKIISQFGAIPAIQLAHAGRKASHSAPWKGERCLSPSEGGWVTVAPSALPFSESTGTPIALDREGIVNVVNAFAKAAERAFSAGYRVVEIHAAHGYLIHQFLSPLSNKRDDAYGGPFENRIRLLLEIVTSVRKTWPEDLPLFVRISCTDWVAGGWDADQSVELAKILRKMGVDLIDSSSGGIIPGVKIPLGPGYQVPFAEKIRRESGIATGAVGLITEAKQAEEIVSKEQADLVIIGRQFLRDPFFPLHAAAELGFDVQWPNQYLRAKSK